MPTPNDVYLPDGSGRLCAPAAGQYSARWASGAALIPNTSDVLVTYADVCVSNGSFRAEGWGFMEYNWQSNALDVGPDDVFPPDSSGAALASDHSLGSPVLSNGKVSLFSSVCTSLFVGCGAGQVYAATLSADVLTLSNPRAYAVNPVATDGSASWQPTGIAIASYPDAPFRMIETTAITGAYSVMTAPTATGPWHLETTGLAPGCEGLSSGFCYALVGHPELSTSSQLVFTYYDPGAGPAGPNGPIGHVVGAGTSYGSVPTVSGISPSRGPAAGGTSVTVTGTNFSITAGATIITFGSTSSANASCSSTTSCVATAPRGSGTVDVVATVNGISSVNSISDQFTYVVPPAPYHPLTPARITDTRSGSGQPYAGQTISQGGTLNIQVTGVGGVPSTGVTAAVLNVTVTNPTAPSYLTVSPAGASRPLASNLNFASGETVPNLVEVGVGQRGQVSIYNASGLTDVVVDVEGFTGSAATTGTGLYNPVVPARITDTRSGSGYPNASETLQAGSIITVQVTGVGGAPNTGVAAAVLNVTATNPTQQSYLTVWPTGATRPTASNVNFVPGQTVPNRVMVPVGTSGQVSVYNPAGSVDVVVDVGGYFTDASDASATGSQFTPTTPARITDTRSGSGEPKAGNNLGSGATLGVQVSGDGGVPASGVTAAVLNVTATNSTQQSYLTVWPTGASQPNISDINWAPGETVANLVVVKLGPDGSVQVYNAAGSTDVVVDVTGWYS
jgi:hypothetical protein